MLFFLFFSLQFSFENCKFKVQRNKEGTGRIVVWMLGVTNSYTIEASFGGSTLGSRKMTHFSTAVNNNLQSFNSVVYFNTFLFFSLFFLQDYEHIGRAFCETLMDYSDENPIKVNKLKKRIRKIRKREKRLKKAKLKQLAEEVGCIINDNNTSYIEKVSENSL